MSRRPGEGNRDDCQSVPGRRDGRRPANRPLSAELEVELDSVRSRRAGRIEIAERARAHLVKVFLLGDVSGVYCKSQTLV